MGTTNREKMKAAIAGQAEKKVRPDPPVKKETAPAVKQPKKTRDKSMVKFRLPVGTRIEACHTALGNWSVTMTIPQEGKEDLVLSRDESGIHMAIMHLGRKWFFVHAKNPTEQER